MRDIKCVFRLGEFNRTSCRGWRSWFEDDSIVRLPGRLPYTMAGNNCTLLCNWGAKKGAGGDVIKKGNGVRATDLSTPIVFVEQVKTREAVFACQNHHALVVTLNTGAQLIVHKVYNEKHDAFATAVSLVKPGDYHSKKYEAFKSSAVSHLVTVNNLIEAAEERTCGYAFHFTLNNCKDAMERMYGVAVGSDGKCTSQQKGSDSGRYSPPPPYSPSEPPARSKRGGPNGGMYGDDSRVSCTFNYNVFGPGSGNFK